MSEHALIPRRVLLASALGLALPAAAFAQCPTANQMTTTIQGIFNNSEIVAKRVRPAAIKGLCEVQVVAQRRGDVLYTDTTGAYLLVNGVLLEIKSRRNLTGETLGALNEELEALNVLPPEDMKKVDALVAMTFGTKGPTVYFVTDPM